MIKNITKKILILLGVITVIFILFIIYISYSGEVYDNNARLSFISYARLYLETYFNENGRYPDSKKAFFDSIKKDNVTIIPQNAKGIMFYSVRKDRQVYHIGIKLDPADFKTWGQNTFYLLTNDSDCTKECSIFIGSFSGEDPVLDYVSYVSNNKPETKF